MSSAVGAHQNDYATFFLQVEKLHKPAKTQVSFIKCLKIQSLLKCLSSCKKGKSK